MNIIIIIQNYICIYNFLNISLEFQSFFFKVKFYICVFVCLDVCVYFTFKKNYQKFWKKCNGNAYTQSLKNYLEIKFN